MMQRNTSDAERPSEGAPAGFHGDPTGSDTHAAFDGGSPNETSGSPSGLEAAAGIEGPGAATADASTGTLERKRRRRGGRGRSRRKASSAEPGGGEGRDDPREPGDEGQRDEPPFGEGGEAGEVGEGKKRRKRRRRRRKPGDDAQPASQSAEERSGREEREPLPAGDEPGLGEGGERKKLRRRRGSRGGRRSKSSAGAPVAFEAIPGEDDELAPQESLPELPDEAEEIGGPRSKKKRRRRSRKHRGDDQGDEARDEDDDEDDDEGQERDGRKTAARAKRAAVANKILVNAADREETRVAVVQDGIISDFQMTVKHHQSLVNDIYRGKVVNLEPAIGAAFIDFGQGRNGFLHTSDVLSAYGDEDWSLDKLLTTKVDLDEWDETSQPAIADEVAEGEEPAEGDSGEPAEGASGKQGRGRERAKRAGQRGRSSRHRPRPRLPISDLLEKGQSVVVQVTKEAIGDKGPTLTTYISIPGRYLVLMPSMARTGVSRKIEDEKERRRLKRILEGLEIPAGMGVIVRTAGVGATKTDLERDLDYLLLLWESFGQRLNLGRGPAPLYEESDVAIRTIRDLFDEGTEAVVVDSQAVYERVRDFTEKLMPENLERVQLHKGPRPLFHHYGVEQDFEKIFARRVDLPSGGSIVFDQTEALVAIDVNSGKTRTDGFDFEDIALKTNLDAVPEIARQIRLRDLGGIIVCDFIDMMKMSNRRAVERALRTAMAGDRARSKLGRISQFGLLELTRQRLGPGMSKMLFQNCLRCRGSGKVRTLESKTAAILRRLGSALTLKGFSQVEVRAQQDALDYLKRNYSKELRDLETKHEREVKLIEVQEQVEDCVLRYLRTDGREVRPGGRRKR